MIVANAAADVTTYFVLRDSTNHAPKTDVTVTDIDIYYVEQGAAISSKVDCTALAAADSAHTDGGAFHVGQGLYRIDWPDAAFDGGVGKKVILIVVCSGVDTTFLEVELSPSVNASSLSAGAITAAVIATGAIDADALAADAVDEILDEVCEGSITLRQAINLMLSVLTGKSSGGGTSTLVFRDTADSKNRLSVTVDANGNRTAVGTRDGS